jgi:CheY-like chemotaxis protein
VVEQGHTGGLGRRIGLAPVVQAVRSHRGTISAASGQGDLRYLAGDPDVDLIVLDMHLKDGHGLSVLRRTRAAGQSCDVIAVTSARDVDVVRQAVKRGGQRHPRAIRHRRHAGDPAADAQHHRPAERPDDDYADPSQRDGA